MQAKHYIVEISRSRHKMYFIALKVPKKYQEMVVHGKGIQYLAGKS